ncbi:MAG TPA: glycosyltransferase family 2 protein [Planctomycetota bacterium]|nr:glycosyltransferase family 2 protein [Planctomycetota bacterium]
MIRALPSNVCAVIPAHEEAAAIARVVRGAIHLLGSVIVVDDGSTDGSAELARREGALVIRWARRRGKGAALRHGLGEAFARGFDAAVTLDADGQHLPQEIPRFLEAYQRGADLVLGDRSEGFALMPVARRAANLALTAALRPFVGPDLKDSQCGFRLITARLYASMRLACEHFDLETEVLLAAARLEVRPVHVRVSTVYGGERSKIRPIADGGRFVRLLVRAALGALPAGRIASRAAHGVAPAGRGVRAG